MKWREKLENPPLREAREYLLWQEGFTETQSTKKEIDWGGRSETLSTGNTSPSTICPVG